MKLFIYELYLRDCVGLKNIKESSIKRIDKKECYIITINANNTKIKLLQSYDRIVAIYDYDTNTLLTECQKIENNRAYKSFSKTTSKHINLFIDIISNEINKTPIILNEINFDSLYL